MTRAHHALRFLACALALVEGCTLVAGIDVCDRPAPEIAETNVRTEGAQLTDGVHPLTPLANGGSYLVFTSVTDPNAEREGSSSIRGILLDPAGASLRTCDAPGEIELQPDQGVRVDRPSVTMPTDELGVGLVVWRRDLRALLGTIVTQSGCPIPLVAPFVIADGTSCVGRAGPVSYTAPAVRSLGDDRFQVIWSEVDSTNRSTICVRDVSAVTSDRFPPTALDPSGAAALLASPGDIAFTLDVVALDRGRFAVAWLEGTTTLRAMLAIFDDHLARIGDVHVLGTPSTAMGFGADRFGLAMTWDGAQIFVAWSDIEPSGATTLVIRELDSDGHTLRSPLSEDGSAVPLAVGALERIDGAVSATPLPQGGALFLYEQRNSAEDPSARRLHATAFDRSGGRRFLDGACDATSFDLAPGDGGRGRLPSMVTSRGGTVTMAWTVDGADGADRSGSALRSVAYSPHALLPLP